MSEKFNKDLVQQIGYLTAKVEDIDKKLNAHTEAIQHVIEDMSKRLTKTEVVLGKIGVAFTVAVFVVTFAINLLGDWVKHFFAK